ncbi:MFS transporter [Clostridium tyrobutyricum]|uniref:MFS transporter n=1 Tax=Clostridium tyrobutyricum TaxID=1519 RepID=UPI001C394E31|nr:MFS transporter [Clostridium tyrobutyricum]MBV4419296.1 MFS transporter [Clostridium tyrobutyricum]
MTEKSIEKVAMPNYCLVVVVLALTTLMAAIDTNIVNIALPTVARSLNASFASVQWIALSYLLAVTSLIVGIGRIGDVFGKKSIFIFGIIVFTAASLLCGISTSIYTLILFRALQGVGGAVLMALSFAILGDLVPKEKIIQSMGILTAMLPIGFALGPSVGGALIGVFSWRSIFFFNVPIGIIAFILVLRFPKIPISEKVEKFDVPGLILLCAALSCYVLSVTFAEDKGLSKIVVLCIVLTIVFVIGFLSLEHRISYPLIRLSMFRDKVLSGSLAISVIMYTVITGAVLILPFYLQRGKLFSTSASGLLMTIGPIGCTIFTPVSTKAARYLGNYAVMIIGIIIFAIGSFFMSTLSGDTSILKFAATILVFNGSLAFFQTPNNASIISSAKPEQRGLASGLLNLSRTIGQTTGAALIGALFYFFTKTKSITTTSPASIVSGIQHTFLIAGGIVIIAFVISLFTLVPKIREERRA